MKLFHVSLLGPRIFSFLLHFLEKLSEHCANIVLCTAHCLWYFVCKRLLTNGLLLYLSILYFKNCGYWTLPMPVAARPKAWVCDRSLARVSGSNPVGGMNVCLF